MSRLFGPPSETISSVSDRDCALAADQIAGAGTIAPAATPVTDFRKSRRFMVMLQMPYGKMALELGSQGLCQSSRKALLSPTSLIWLGIAPHLPYRAGAASARIAYKDAYLLIKYADVLSAPLAGDSQSAKANPAIHGDWRPSVASPRYRFVGSGCQSGAAASMPSAAASDRA